jgi:hypothetical protein
MAGFLVDKVVDPLLSGHQLFVPSSPRRLTVTQFPLAIGPAPRQCQCVGALALLLTLAEHSV